MRSAILVMVAACGSSSPPPTPPAPPVPTSEPVAAAPRTQTCADAAFGIESSTKGLRPADQEIVPVVRSKCLAETWSQTAIDCFAKLRSADDILACTDKLTEQARTSLLTELRGAAPDATDQAAELLDVKHRLAAVSVGIKTCDELVQEVTRVMDCESFSLSDRILLGTETAEAWSISTARLTVADRVRVGNACGKSLDDLQKHATQQAC